MGAVKKWRAKLMGMIIALTALALFSPSLAFHTSPARSATAFTGDPVEAELPGTVNCMLQDSSGFLWFGTRTGLYRYDGYSLWPYSLPSGPANRFAAGFITSLAEDDAQNIWIGTFGAGLYKLNPHTGEAVRFSGDASTSGGPGDNFIRAIRRDQRGKLWIGTQNKGLYCLDPVSGHFTHQAGPYENTGHPGGGTITAIARDRAGLLWIGTAGGGISKLDPRRGEFLPWQERLSISGGAPGNIAGLYADKTGFLWIVTGDGRLSGLDTSSGQFVSAASPDLADCKVTAVCEDNSGTLWVGTQGNGVGTFNRESGEFTARRGGSYPNEAPGSHRVVSLFGDNSGNLWFGTEGNGIDKINTNLNFISYGSSAYPGGLSFSDDVILSVYKDSSGILWLGTADGGVNRFDRVSGRVTYYKHDPGNSRSISSNSICAIYEDSRGTLWFGAIDGTLNRFEPASGGFVHYRVNSVGQLNNADNGIVRIHEDGDGLLWACAASGGLVRLDPDTGRMEQYVSNPADPRSIGSNHVLSMVEDQGGVFWIGTGEGGLYKMDSPSETFTRYGINEQGSTSQTFHYNVNSMVNDGGVLWLGTDRGLFKFNKYNGKAFLMEGQGQTAPLVIFGLLKDHKENLWLSTPDGLIRYSISAGVFKKYDAGGGLRSNQYTFGSYCQSSDGEMFFGGTNGFSSFYPDQIRDNIHKPPVVITDFKIFDTPAKIAGAGDISLTYQDNFISFEFAALDYAEPEKNQYAYKLEGFDRDWHHNGSRRYASYTNLDGGEYVLRVKASNNDGLWNEQGMQIKITVAPPFWETPLFYALVLASAFAATAVVIKIRTRALELRSRVLEHQVMERTRALNLANEQLHQINQVKSDFLSMVSHEIRTPLSAILGFTELIAAKIEKAILPRIDLRDQKIRKATETIDRDLNIILSEGDRLSALVDNLLNISKIESGKMDRANDAVAVPEIIEQSLLTARPLMEKAGLSLVVEVEDGLPEILGDKDMLAQVLINLIANAVKHTREGHIRVGAAVAATGGEILFSVADTGAGISDDHLDKIFDRFYKVKSHLGKNSGSGGLGLGLYICKQIIENHGGKIWAKSRPGKGSTFYFTLPAHLE